MSLHECPDCGSSKFYINTRSHVFWCEDCEREYWREAGEWYSCGESGEADHV